MQQFIKISPDLLLFKPFAQAIGSIINRISSIFLSFFLIFFYCFVFWVKFFDFDITYIFDDNFFVDLIIVFIMFFINYHVVRGLLIFLRKRDASGTLVQINFFLVEIYFSIFLSLILTYLGWQILLTYMFVTNAF